MPSETSTGCADQSVEQLGRELAEAREQQATTAEILTVISSAPMDSQRVFAEIAASAGRLCDASDAAIHQVDGEVLRLVASHGSIPKGDDTLPLTREVVTGRAVLDKQTIQVADVQAETGEYPVGSANARRLGHRTLLAVPLMRSGQAIGVIGIRRTEVRPFSHRQIELLKTFADQAVIAIENTRLFQAEQASKRELTEALEQQTATADVLKVISRSALDLQRVLDALVESAARLCNANDGAIFQVFGDGLRLVAHLGQIPLGGSVGQYTVPLVRGRIYARAVIDRQTIHIADILAEADEYPESQKVALQVGWRTALCVPLLHAGEAIGVIFIRRTEVRPFTERQIELVNTFADQAVIAIENTRLFEAEQASKRELQESLEYQTAISDVLGVISRAPSELKPVLDAIVATARGLCEAERAVVWQIDEDQFRPMAFCGMDAVGIEKIAHHRLPIGPGSVLGRAADEGRAVQVLDAALDNTLSPTQNELARAGNIHSILAVPLMRDGRLTGCLSVSRTVVRSFSNRQVALLETFADQAVIAIENTRLFEAEQARTKEVEAKSAELRESLEYQTATSEVLNVISRSPTNVQPVFDTIAQSAAHLCKAQFCHVFRFDGRLIHFAAVHGLTPEGREALRSLYPMPPGRATAAARSILTCAVEEIPDVRADSDYSVPHSLVIGFRSVAAVPMLKDGRPIGTIAVMRSQTGYFPERQIQLMQTFADQAVIAIENTRLFEAEQESKSELTEALEQQTATADVLKVISRSALDVQKVLDALVESAARLCDANDAAIFQVFGDSLRLVAHHGQIPTIGPVGQLTIPLERGSIGARAVIDRRPIHVADMLAEGDEYPASRKRAVQLGYRTSLAVPLVHADEAIGFILIRRAEVRPFNERQIELVSTFADQAVIAIENSRLFEEVQARTSELAKTVEELEIASQHKSQFVANMSHELRTPLAAILGYAELIQEGFYEPQGPKSLDALTRIRSNGKHLLGLINTVLDIAKIESGQFTLNMSEYAIESVVETVRSATESLAQNKKLALKTEVAKSLPIGLGDEQRLTQVLLNLVGNAIKFTDTGEVRVTAKAVNGHFNISVTDTGPGIPEDHQMRIFEQFHQVDSSNTKAKGGTGLGLAIAKQIVEMHGGRIWVESTFGKGSTFQMELPTRAELRNPAS